MRRSHLGLLVLTLVVSGTFAAGGPALGAPPGRAGDLARSPELSTSSQLADRRSLFVGDRFWGMGAQDGSYPATGFHTRGEMGGFWTPPIKLLDGIWFKAGDTWLTSSKYTSGWGYQRMDLGTHNGVGITRTDFAPDRLRAGLVGLRLESNKATTLPLAVDAHSELMKVYPWGETEPSQKTYNLQDTASVAGKNLVFREQGTTPAPEPETHDYAALVGSKLTPTGSSLGAAHRGPQGTDPDGPAICPASGPDADPQPPRCDDTEYGKGTGGQLRYNVSVPKGGRTIWFSIGGSDQGLAAATAAQDRALAHPARLLREKVAARHAVARNTQVSLPGDRLLQRSVQWSKQNLAESVQESRDLKVRPTNGGTEYPPTMGTVPKARWYGAGFPDYPWLFATDGEYTGFAAVTSGQFGTIKSHLRALRDVSVVANGQSGKVVHEVTPDGQVYFGANDDAGNTDETAKFPSIVALVWRWTGDDRFRDEMYPFAVRNLRYIFRELDADGDGWPEGLGNVERPGMGEEKLDNTVATIRGLRDLADLAASKGDTATRRWANGKASDLEKRFEAAWWNGSDTKQYADSLEDPGNDQVFQRHWIGVTPAEVELKRPGKPDGPLASTRARTRAGREARRGLLHRRVRALPHRHGSHLGDGRQQGSDVRQRDLLGAVRAVGVHAEHLDHGRGGGGAGPDGHRPAAALHDRQRARAARPERVGAAGSDAGDRALARLRQQHGEAVHRAVDGAAGVGCLRDPVAGGALPARRLTRPRSQQASAWCRRCRPARAGLRPPHPAGLRCRGRAVPPARGAAADRRTAERALAPDHRRRAARRHAGGRRCGWTAAVPTTASSARRAAACSSPTAAAAWARQTWWSGCDEPAVVRASAAAAKRRLRAERPEGVAVDRGDDAVQGAHGSSLLDRSNVTVHNGGEPEMMPV